MGLQVQEFLLSHINYSLDIGGESRWDLDAAKTFKHVFLLFFAQSLASRA